MRKLLLFLLVIAGLPGCKPFEKKPVVTDGALDLSSWNFNSKGIIALDGNWEFYWEQLYSPADFANSSKPSMTGYILVPTSWNGQVIGKTKLSGQGFATYRLRVNGCTNKLLGIRVPDAYSAYKLWINGVVVSSNGSVGTNAINEKAELRPLIRVFKSDTVNELVLQVSNFFLDKGGANSSMTIGTPEQIIHERDLTTIFTMFTVGMLMIMCVYHIVIFLLSRNDFTAFWFSILCLSISLRCLVVNDKFIHVLFPGFSADMASRLEYGSIFVGGILFGMFVRSLLPKDFSRTFMYIMLAIGAVEFVTIFFLPARVYTSWLSWYQLACVQLLYYIYVMILSAIRKRPLAIAMVVVVLVTTLVTINDILYARLIINTGFIISYAVPFMLFTQSYFIASRIGHALDSVQKLSVELNDANMHLEQKVIARTLELETEKKKTDDLLLNILPEETAAELKEKGHSNARTYSMVSVMFIDVAGFAHIDEHTGAAMAVGEIDHCFQAFDAIVEAHGIEKIKTIANVYLCAAGLPVPSINHTEHIINAAREIRAFMLKRQLEQKHAADFSFDIRIGISMGPLVAGIVGTKKFAYDIWGDTVNTAARMQQHCEPGKINISGRTYEQVKNKFECIYRGKIEAKNKGMTDMYYVV